MKKMILILAIFLLLSGCGQPEGVLRKYRMITPSGINVIEFSVCYAHPVGGTLAVNCYNQFVADSPAYVPDAVYIATEFSEIK